MHTVVGAQEMSAGCAPGGDLPRRDLRGDIARGASPPGSSARAPIRSAGACARRAGGSERRGKPCSEASRWTCPEAVAVGSWLPPPPHARRRRARRARRGRWHRRRRRRQRQGNTAEVDYVARYSRSPSLTPISPCLHQLTLAALPLLEQVRRRAQAASAGGEAPRRRWFRSSLAASSRSTFSFLRAFFRSLQRALRSTAFSSPSSRKFSCPTSSPMARAVGRWLAGGATPLAFLLFGEGHGGLDAQTRVRGCAPKSQTGGVGRRCEFGIRAP